MSWIFRMTRKRLSGVTGERQRRWDLSFLEDAKHASRRSKDPSTQVGAVIIRPNMTEASRGYNGFARGVIDTPERLANRDLKYQLVIHAEENAILTARESLEGYTLYTWPMPPCDRCASRIIQAGIRRVVGTTEINREKFDRWLESFQFARDLFIEAGVEYVLL
jgi:dCMP deaminase